MKLPSSTLILFFASITVYAQCLTDFTKLVPEPSIDTSSDFGRSVAMYDRYMAIGVPNSDSLGRLTGIVYIYEKVNDTWEKLATLAPSDPVDALQFGSGVALSENYLFVSCSTFGGKVYIFKKGPGGWTSQTELSSLSVAGSFYFGINPYGNRAIAIADDEQTVAITDIYAPISASNANPYYIGAIYVYHKLPFQDWNSPIIPKRLIAPRGNVADFGRAGVALKDNHLVTGSPYTEVGGNLFIFHDPSGTFSNLTLQATLSPRNDLSFALGAYNIVLTNDGIFTPAAESVDGQLKQGILYYQKPISGNWEDTTPTCSFLTLPGTNDTQYGNAMLITNGTDLLVSTKSTVGDGHFNLIKKGVAGWCTPVYQNIDYAPSIPGAFSNLNPYGTVIACNQQTDAVLGFVPIPDNNYATIALKSFSNQGTEWKSNLIYPKKKSTAGHFYGNTVVGYDNHLFVGATNDGTNVPGVGAVYYYQKQGNSWNMKSKILAPSTSRFDDNFGSALAFNKEYLAVGANGFESGHSAIGRVFVYKKGATGWEASQLVQEIALPEDQLIVYAYGDNLAMTDNWLIIPYVQNNPYRIMMAIYKFDGTQWIFYQSLEASGGNFFARSTTIAVSIENETLLAGNTIFEINAQDQWEPKYTLSPSDPEGIQISPDFNYLVTNGSLFGHSNSINDNTIFIGAPLKDHGGTWDVGAVYVYTKEPGEAWSSRTETTKILPRVIEEGELFGYSLKNSGNTVLVGAPGNDFYKDGVTARNKPGRAYVFQAKDYFWQDVVRLIDITGDTFKKDYYGVKVYMDNSDFFIGASIEDIATGQLSGTVYVTPSPPIIKLVPPACSSAASIDLFGYPFGGTWTGPGIIDAAEGRFDPKIAGAGIHEFRYKTPSCAYEGILRIEVQDPPVARLLTPIFLPVCENKSFSVTIEVAPEENVNYLWYFRTNINQPFAPLEILTPTITATKRGEYQLKAYTKSCEVFTPVITISDEEIEIVIDSPFKTCERNSTPVQLLADPPDGTWIGMGISNNQLIATNLNVGIYKATYTYVSTVGCIYTKDADVMVVPAPVPVIDRTQGNLCDEGMVTLQVRSPIPGTTYTWLFRAEDNINTVLGTSGAIEVDKHGSYSVIGDYDVCTISSQPIIINDQLKVTIEPVADYTEVCAEDKLNIIVSEPSDATFTWLFSPSNSEPLTLLFDRDQRHEVSQSGYYQVLVSKGVCIYESDLKQIVIQPSDTVFVPNVFSPNGDGSNEIFKLVGTPKDASLVIINRYGSQMFEGSAQQGWTGGDASAGVYYWFVQYLTCQKEKKVIKGTVHLIR